MNKTHPNHHVPYNAGGQTVNASPALPGFTGGDADFTGTAQAGGGEDAQSPPCPLPSGPHLARYAESPAGGAVPEVHILSQVSPVRF